MKLNTDRKDFRGYKRCSALQMEPSKGLLKVVHMLVNFMPDQFPGLHNCWALTILEVLCCMPQFSLIWHTVVNFSACTQPLTFPNVKIYPKSSLEHRVT